MLLGIKRSSTITEAELNKELTWFLKNSPTPFHAVENMQNILKQNGFKELQEDENWFLEDSCGYFVKRNDSSLVAFYSGTKEGISQGLRIVGAHTDSPCLKVKPNPDLTSFSYAQLSVEIYGGVILSTWFDRDLSLAGKVTYLTAEGELKKSLVNFHRPIAVIPNLAIHLNREVNEGHSINKQKEMPPILFQVEFPYTSVEMASTSFVSLLKHYLLEQEKATSVQQILGHDLFFYDTQEPNIVGYEHEFITGSRLDNLLSCYIGLRSLLEADKNLGNVLVCNDHEEVGSASYIGAQGPFLKSVLQRICGKGDEDGITLRSMMISVDNAHGIHPNYFERHDLQHGPLLNRGPVLKINANQRYATNSETGGAFAYLCYKARVPYQVFATRSDMGCGSTIGPITSTLLGVKTVDIGVPTFAMHSIREMAGVKDSFYLYKVLCEFFHQQDLSFHF